MGQNEDELHLKVQASQMSPRDLERLAPVVRIDQSATDFEGTIDLDRLARVLAVYRAVARYRYDWRWRDPADLVPHRRLEKEES